MSRVILAALATGLALAAARPLTDDEMTGLYGRRLPADPGPIKLRSRDLGWLVDANQTLRQAAAAAGIYVGAALAQAHLQNTSDPGFALTAAAEFDLVTAENECKFAETEGQEGQYSLDPCTYVTSFMRVSHGGVVRGHNFVWGQDNPYWLTSINNPTTLQSVMSDHISHVGGAYDGQFYAWDAVNEPVCDDNNCPQGGGIFKNVSPWSNLPNYVEVALGLARSTDHTALIFVNDYGGEGMNAKSNRIYSMAQNFTSRGVPIDGIGLQMHISIDQTPTAADVATNINRLCALNLTVHITEMDVKCAPPCSGNRADLQAQIYGDMLEACLNSTCCKSFETWGISDKYSWLNSFDNPTGIDFQPLLFDNNYNKKAPYYEVLSVLQKYAGKRGTR